MKKLTQAALILAASGISCCASTILDRRHGYCAGAGQCIDNGTNSPTTSNPPVSFGFTVSPGLHRETLSTCWLRTTYRTALRTRSAIWSGGSTSQRMTYVRFSCTARFTVSRATVTTSATSNNADHANFLILIGPTTTSY
jgi:hypothetical protein